MAGDVRRSPFISSSHLFFQLFKDQHVCGRPTLLHCRKGITLSSSLRLIAGSCMLWSSAVAVKEEQRSSSHH